MTLDEAIALAAQAHHGQVDKKGEPYILHPLRVMQHSGPNHEHMIVAVLHDTLEDTYVTEELLLEKGLPIHLVEAVFALTRQDGESYREFVVRCAKNLIARHVKIKDLEDNMSKERNQPPVDEKTARRLLKYRRAHAYLYSTILDEVKNLPHGTTEAIQYRDEILSALPRGD
jgi:guanosine-3',5'-bis(diphosphate) 3'-pyrophosphohydrolase